MVLPQGCHSGSWEECLHLDVEENEDRVHCCFIWDFELSLESVQLRIVLDGEGTPTPATILVMCGVMYPSTFTRS